MSCRDWRIERLIVPRLTRILTATSLLALWGCAYVAVKTPTPAALFRADEIEQGPPPSDESYYVLVFGSQTVPKVPRKTHTWATVVRVTSAPTGAPADVEASTI